MKLPKIVWIESNEKQQPLNKTYLGLGISGLAVILFMYPVIISAILFVMGLVLIILDQQEKKNNAAIPYEEPAPAKEEERLL